MMDVAAGIWFACETIAFRIDRSEIARVFRALDSFFARVCIHRTGTAVARREYAIECINAGFDADENIFGFSDSEKMPRLFFRQFTVYFVENSQNIALA